MRLTIVPEDGVIIVNGDMKYQPFDLSQCAIPSDVHALQWYENRGWIEFSDDGDPFTPKPANQDIYSLPDWANACVQVWTDWQPPAPPDAAPTNQPVSIGTQTL